MCQVRSCHTGHLSPNVFPALASSFLLAQHWPLFYTEVTLGDVKYNVTLVLVQTLCCTPCILCVAIQRYRHTESLDCGLIQLKIWFHINFFFYY